jgi:hypothetical protein
MSLAVSIQIDTRTITASLVATEKALQDGEGMHGAIAEATGKVVKDHLTAKYLPRDGPRGDFWADVISSTESTATSEAATVTLNELGIGLRYYGGEVTPGKSISSYTGELTKALAIPSDKVPVAGGRQIRPGKAGILAFIQSRNPGETVGVLVEGALQKITRGVNKGKDRRIPKPGGSLLYTLRTITRHKPDPNILPSDDELTAAAVAAITRFVSSFEGVD